MFAALPATAVAQRVPATDSGAIGGEVGIFVPRDDFSVGLKKYC